MISLSNLRWFCSRLSALDQKNIDLGIIKAYYKVAHQAILPFIKTPIIF